MDDAHINTINKMAAKLEKRQSADELLTVRKRRRQLNDRSVSLSPPHFSSSDTTGAHRCFICPAVLQYIAPDLFMYLNFAGVSYSSININEA